MIADLKRYPKMKESGVPVAEGLLTEEEGKTMLGESIETKEPVSLVERRAFMKLPLEERRKIMARQAKEMAEHYKKNKSTEYLETGDMLDY